jgi:hypothetical protein
LPSQKVPSLPNDSPLSSQTSSDLSYGEEVEVEDDESLEEEVAFDELQKEKELLMEELNAVTKEREEEDITNTELNDKVYYFFLL